jgi:DNA-binding NtrC family response regulator
MATILVVDDEVGIRDLLSEILSDEGHNVRSAESASAAREARSRERPDLVLLDIWMPDTDGISLLKEWASSGQLTMPVVMMSGHATIETAVEATRIGATDFLEKPIALQKLLATVKRVLRQQETQPATRLSLASIGRAPALVETRKRLAQLATVGLPLLLRGGAGMMPELFGRLVQQPNTPWVTGTAALAETPQDVLTQAAGGVLFVEELATLSRGAQRGLAFAAERAARQKVRIISFSAEDPELLVAERGFDADLLARLSGVVMRLPMLREFAEDIPEIASLMLSQLVEGRVCPPRRLSTAALNTLRQAPWQRNLESLAQVVRSAALTSLEEEIGPKDVERVLGPEAPDAVAPGISLDQPLREAREAFERAYLEHHLAREQGSIARVADKSGLERTHLYRKLKQLGIGLARKDE